ncbi:MAG: ribonucleotide reductase subunit alpha [Acidovorax sp.]|uniref:ribonucleotide reductase subunit alpha n=1 Tax=unclassified Diaphorobacter TaxID=2649760 RepID=UPI000DB6DCBC|nr:MULTISPECIES: ribonucleotide reductase subunit alpha [unclassified Diaphorobacter]PZU42019.1 MAG: ribonucleotide reductase subunit alpha [Acidovorax sp.]QYY26056.1 ribonucleotide reductase subunit alpha [Diaphorobacter sp. MNS-0]
MQVKTEINSFDDLLRAARSHRERQRLLFVFAGAELPDEATPEQRERFAQGEGGVLVPLMCVDKLPEELESFDALVRESQQFEQPGQPWRLVFTAALSGTAAQAPSDDDADKVLRRMVEAVKTGAFSAYLPFNRDGQPVRLG